MEIEIKPPTALDARCPEPGFYRGVPFETYQHIAAANASLFHRFRESDSWAYALGHEKDTTLATRSGSLFHMACLEPERFAATVQFGGPVNPKTGKEYGRETKAWAEAEAAAEKAGKVIVAEEERERFSAMVESAKRHPIARRYLFRTDAARELTMVWRHTFKRMSGEERSVMWKGRADIVPLSHEKGQTPEFTDVKTTEQHLSPLSLMRMFDRYGYADQAAIYRAGFRQLTGVSWRPVWVVVQKNLGHELMVIDIPEEWLDTSEAVWANTMPDLEACISTGRWLRSGERWNDDYTVPLSGIQQVEVPRWRVAQNADGM